MQHARAQFTQGVLCGTRGCQCEARGVKAGQAGAATAKVHITEQVLQQPTALRPGWQAECHHPNSWLMATYSSRH